jgi:hypothetical protein
MKKLTMTYKELYEQFEDSKEKFYVKTNTGEFTKINACVKKTSDTYDVTVNNEYNITIGDKHCFMKPNQNEILAENLSPGDYIKTTNGDKLITSKCNFLKDQEVYDIAIDAPHWYINDSYGIIHHNTAFSLIMAKAYMDKYPEAALLFYDTEFGTPQAYFDTFGIDTDRVLHTPVTDIEQLKFDCMKQLTEFERGDHVIIIIDSVGNIASKKEVDDALNEKSVADMTRAKQLKSFFRMVTPHLNLKDIPMICVGHTYSTMEMFSKAIISGGCLIPGTKIKLFDGTYKNIQDFVIGDVVQTIEGNKEVTATWNPDTLENGTPECYEIEFEDGYKVTCSDIHKFLIDNEWVEARNLKIGFDVKQL